MLLIHKILSQFNKNIFCQLAIISIQKYIQFDIQKCHFLLQSQPSSMKIFFITTFSFCLFFLSIRCTQPYKKIIHNIDDTARCLDGSPAALYEHIGSDSSKFLIFFGGGGSCGGLTLSQTIQNCYQRSKTYLGSSKYMLDEMRPEGIVSTDQTKSKFATWSKFIFAYCDGSFHQGNRNSPVSYKDQKLYSRGSNITRAHLRYIQQKYNFKNATQVVVSGVSAGAMAAFLWTNQIQRSIRNPEILSTIIDSGLFINDTTVESGIYKSSVMLENLYKFSNLNQGTPFEQCNKFTSKGKQWNCFFLQFSYSLIKGRVLNIISLYDAYDLTYQYQIKCIVQGHEGQTFNNCSSKQQNAINQRFEKSLALSNKFMDLSSNHSIWAISCSNHVYLGNWKFYSSQNQTVSSIEVVEAVQKFVLQKARVNSIDNFKWPLNSKCAY